MATSINSNSVSMLSSAILGALTYGDKDRAVKLAGLGIELGNAKTESDQIAVWRKIETAAEWVGGSSAE